MNIPSDRPTTIDLGPIDLGPPTHFENKVPVLDVEEGDLYSLIMTVGWDSSTKDPSAWSSP